MGLLNDFFVASPDDITADLIRQGPAGRYPTISVTSLTVLSLALLLAAMEGSDLARAVARLDVFEVVDVGVDGPWMVRLPSELADGLARASESDLKHYSIRWTEGEEMSGADPKSMQVLLERLSALARQAQRDGKSLYLWICL